MLYVDLPSRQEFTSLNQKRADACVSIYLGTTPLTQQIDQARTEFGKLFKVAREQLEANGFDKRRLATLQEQIDDLSDDEEFWRLQANSLAVLATPDSLRTFRLANHVSPMAMVSDRFHLTPLFRAISFPNAAYVLSLSENAVRLVEVFPDLPASEIRVPELPKDAASAVGKSTLNDRAPSGRIQGAEGQNVRLRQFARRVDAALRTRLAGRDTPLILATSDRLATIYASVNSYPHLVSEHISTATDRTTDDELGAASREVLDSVNAKEIKALVELYKKRASAGRATSDLADAARAATFGAIDTLLVNIDSNVPGVIDDESGAITLAKESSATTYDIVDEIAGRALISGARVLGVRKSDLPSDGELAAILRFAV
jgi:hypothetical protein